MHELRKTAETEEDLIEIWVYCLRKWGIEQADAYIDELEAAMARLADHPKLGKGCEELRPGYRSLAAGRRRADYRIEPATIRIIRVLHERMEPDQRL